MLAAVTRDSSAARQSAVLPLGTPLSQTTQGIFPMMSVGAQAILALSKSFPSDDT